MRRIAAASRASTLVRRIPARGRTDRRLTPTRCTIERFRPGHVRCSRVLARRTAPARGHHATNRRGDSKSSFPSFSSCGLSGAGPTARGPGRAGTSPSWSTTTWRSSTSPARWRSSPPPGTEPSASSPSPRRTRRCSSQGVLTVRPDYSVDDSPGPGHPRASRRRLARLQPQRGRRWHGCERSPRANELSMSVCSGAFILAQLGPPRRATGDDALGRRSRGSGARLPQGPGADRRSLRRHWPHRHHRRRLRGHRRSAARGAAPPRRRRGLGDRAVHAVRSGSRRSRPPCSRSAKEALRALVFQDGERADPTALRRRSPPSQGTARCSPGSAGRSSSPVRPEGGNRHAGARGGARGRLSPSPCPRWATPSSHDGDACAAAAQLRRGCSTSRSSGGRVRARLGPGAAGSDGRGARGAGAGPMQLGLAPRQVEAARSDQDLSSLRGDARFEQILSRTKVATRSSH